MEADAIAKAQQAVLTRLAEIRKREALESAAVLGVENVHFLGLSDGGFYSPDQLTDEPLADYRLDTLLAHFTASPNDVRRLNVNTCSTDALQRHPYLRYQQAKAIYTLRRRQVRLRSIDDLRALPDLPDSTLLRLAPYLCFE